MNNQAVGSIIVSDQLLCTCVANSAREYPGVIGLDKVASEKALDILSKDTSVSNGVRISRKDGKPVLDIFIVVEYGTQIPKLAWELQNKIKDDIKTITDQNVEDINIHIEGVDSKEQNIE